MTLPTSAERSPDPELAERLHGDLQAEYVKLVEIVSTFDQRLLTIKGWGVTLSLASLGLAFQQNHYGLFLVAAVSGLGFWLVEATTKEQQMRYYPRMGDIEFIAYELFGLKTPSGVSASSPLIDWGWRTARPRIRSLPSTGDPLVPRRWPTEEQGALTGEQRLRTWLSEHVPGRRDRVRAWMFPHVALPHVIAVVMGVVLFALGLMGVFGPI